LPFSPFSTDVIAEVHGNIRFPKNLKSRRLDKVFRRKRFSVRFSSRFRTRCVIFAEIKSPHKKAHKGDGGFMQERPTSIVSTSNTEKK